MNIVYNSDQYSILAYPAQEGFEVVDTSARVSLANLTDIEYAAIGKFTRQVLEVADEVVPHPHDGGLGGAHGRPATASAGTSAPAPAWARAASVTTSTCTAVTLYSGQLVAQSEFSVVTTLAPVTGWWKVV